MQVEHYYKFFEGYGTSPAVLENLLYVVCKINVSVAGTFNHSVDVDESSEGCYIIELRITCYTKFTKFLKE